MPEVDVAQAKTFLADFVDVTTIPDDRVLEVHSKIHSAVQKHAPAPSPEKWRELLPVEYKEAPQLKDTKDLPSLAKQFIDLQGHLGNSIRIPSKDAAPEAIAEFQRKLVERVPGLYYMPKDGDEEGVKALRTKLGTPADPKDYEVPVAEGAQEVPGFREAAHKLGLTKTQVKELATWYNGMNKAALDAFAADHTKGMQQLEAEWGAAKDTKIANIVKLAERTNAPKELVEMAKAGKLGPGTMKWLDGLVKSIGTEGVNLTKDTTGTNVLTPAEASLQINEIMARKEYWDPESAIGADLRKKVLELAKQADPTASTEIASLRAGMSS